MSTSRSLDDFVEFLRALQEAGFAYAVIGGCAVGAYARMCGLTVVSADLDIYVSATTLPELLAWAESVAIRVAKRPQTRTVPVAVLE